jgi:arabinose-5-phosphate isomerase
MSNKNDFLSTAKQVLKIEAAAIYNLIPNLNESFNDLCQLILDCKGKIILTGMGKSGHIARKIAATMASTGTSAFFVHPADASHGDLGMVSSNDLVIVFSNSGETDELITILPALKRSSIKIIAITGNNSSTIARYSNVSLTLPVGQEACPLKLAPTTSTTCFLAIGDAIAISLLQARKFNQLDFAKYHPSGRLGKRLLLKVSDIMHSGNKIPIANENMELLEAVVEMSKKCFGLLVVVDKKTSKSKLKKIIGVISDGDLRRMIDKRLNIYNTKIIDIMNKEFKFIHPEALVLEALAIMEKYKIFALPVIANDHIVGIFNMHDVLKAGIL